MIRIIAIGKKHEDWILTGLRRYQKRLQRPYDVKWELVPHDSAIAATARQNESEQLQKRLDTSDYVVLLDETGKQLDSPAVAALCEQQFTSSRNIVFVIGGAYGVSAGLKQRADLIWSLSPLVFPHQLVRLILIEQLYRSQEIARGGQYHHS